MIPKWLSGSDRNQCPDDPEIRKNKVLALFDNDTAATDALKGLSKVTLPQSIKVLQYPNLQICENYPTEGPSGPSVQEVNGLAGSIELYLGEDCLTVSGELTPVHWQGYNQSLKQYQGEIMNKKLVQTQFLEKLKICTNDTDKIKDYDWSGINMIFQHIFNALDAKIPKSR